MNLDLRAHKEVSKHLPVLPAPFTLRRTKSAKQERYIAQSDGSILTTKTARAQCGIWWPHSGTCLEIVLEGCQTFFRYTSGNEWESSDRQALLTWPGMKKKSGEDSCLQEGRRGNMSRFRTIMLPLDRLDACHREQLSCMGFNVCFNSEIGRVLVTTRIFHEGEIVIYSRVSSFDVTTDEEVFELFRAGHPSSCYLLVPRLKKLYYNRDTFCNEDPIKSGDMWYLVNHSSRPNLEVVLRARGIQFKAKRTIYPNEPLVWSYPACFFGKEEHPVDLPQYIVPDRGDISVRE